MQDGGLYYAGMYRPTQDPEWLQLRTLEALGSSIFVWCSGSLTHSAALLSTDSAACRQALSAARVLGVLMDVEHRAAHLALDQLWAVVWRCALLEEGDKIHAHMNLSCPGCAVIELPYTEQHTQHNHPARHYGCF